MTEIDSSALRAAIQDGHEIAVLDLREQGEFGTCHLFHAVNAPLSRIDLEVPRLVPCRTTRVVIVSGGVPALATRGARCCHLYTVCSVVPKRSAKTRADSSLACIASADLRRRLGVQLD